MLECLRSASLKRSAVHVVTVQSNTLAPLISVRKTWEVIGNVNKFLVVVFLTCLLLGAKTVAACDCVGPRGKASLVYAKVAFSGKVIKIEYLDNREQAVPEPRIIVTFRVYRVWKGEPTRKIVLHTVFNKWTCNGYWFKEGKEYLVFARAGDSEEAKMFPKTKNTLGVSICGGTFLLADAQGDVKELGAGKIPL